MPIGLQDFRRLMHGARTIELSSDRHLRPQGSLSFAASRLLNTQASADQIRATQTFCTLVKAKYPDRANDLLRDAGLQKPNAKLNQRAVKQVFSKIPDATSGQDRRRMGEFETQLSDLLGRVINNSLEKTHWDKLISIVTEEAGARDPKRWIQEAVEKALADQGFARALSRVNLIEQISSNQKLKNIVNGYTDSDPNHHQAHLLLRKAILSLDPLPISIGQSEALARVFKQR